MKDPSAERVECVERVASRFATPICSCKAPTQTQGLSSEWETCWRPRMAALQQTNLFERDAGMRGS